MLDNFTDFISSLKLLNLTSTVLDVALYILSTLDWPPITKWLPNCPILRVRISPVSVKILVVLNLRILSFPTVPAVLELGLKSIYNT